MAENSDNDFEETVRLHRQGDRLFDRYVLKKRLGQGGMGVVWQAFDERLDIDVALKLLPDALRTNEGALNQLKHEAQKCIKLTHSRIVRVFDFIVTDELAALSMEFVDGQTLAHLRMEKATAVFSVEEIRGWIWQIGEALHYAHTEAKIVHRDLKPSNVMINADGKVKVADFGISRSLDGALTGPVMREMVTGTLAYMGPQQLNGDAPSVQDDIYALGAMIYEFLTSKPPFYSGDVCGQIETKMPDAPVERRESLGISGEMISEEWATVVLSCLAKRGEDRPQSIRAVMEGLGLSVGAIRERRREDGWVPWLVGGIVVLATLVLAFSSMIASGDGNGTENPNGPTTAPEIEDQTETWEAIEPFTNSLGMVFVKIPGLDVVFATHETTVGMFRTFVDATGHDADTGMYRQITTPEELQAHFEETGRDTNHVDLKAIPPFYGKLGGWREPGYEQTENHPIAGMSVNDALAFCRWLTDLEREEGRITESYEYSMPSDYEWSVAAGMVNESMHLTPKERVKQAGNPSIELDRIFPWGEWSDDSLARGNYDSDADPYVMAAPVGMFPPTEHGLYDLGGNVSEWCRDLYDERGEYGVLRGNSWFGVGEKSEPQSAWRHKPEHSKPHKRNATFGFRCVLKPTAIK